MSGMKFRLKCSGCGAAYFTPDRKARECPKCSKKATSSKPSQFEPAGSPNKTDQPHAGSEFNRGERPSRPEPTGSRPAYTRKFAPKPKPGKEPAPKKPSKIKELNPELEQRLLSVYEEKYSDKQLDRRNLVQLISDELWLRRNVVAQTLHRLLQPPITITQDVIDNIIVIYKDFVDKGERPEAGRRNFISKSLGVPYPQVKRIVYEWSCDQFKASPTVELTREQKFEVEKLYFRELKNGKHPLDEIPSVISGQLGYTIPYQVARWLDTLHDDDRKFSNVPDVPADIESRIWDAYKNYLDSQTPPDRGLHTSIAQIVGDITSRQVHKSLHRFRKVQRETYPLK